MASAPIRLLLCVSFVFLAACGEAEWRVGSVEQSSTEEVGAERRQLGHWEELTEGLAEGGRVVDFAHLESTVYALVEAEGQTRLYSRDEGAWSWAASALVLRAGERLQRMARVDRSLYLTAQDTLAGGGSVYRLDFVGDPWKRLEGAPDLPASALVKRGDEVLVAFGGDKPGIYASADRGQSWSLRGAPSDGPAAFLASSVQAFVASPGSLRFFAVGAPSADIGELYLSDDAGASWTQNPKLSGSVWALHAKESWVLMELSESGALRSDNYGNTWHPMDVGGQSVRSFCVTSADGAFAATAAGVYVTWDGGQIWVPTPATGPAEGLELDSLYLAGSTLWGARGGRVFAAPME